LSIRQYYHTKYFEFYNIFCLIPDSKEELEDLKTAYTEFKGDMNEILNNVCCSTIDDEPRFAEIIRGWIKAGEVEDFPKFSKETKKSRESRKRKVTFLTSFDTT